MEKMPSFARIEIERLRREFTPKPQDVDPVFEGLVREQKVFTQNLRGIIQAAVAVERALYDVGNCINVLSESIVQLTRWNAEIAADACKSREAATTMSRVDAPFSIISKFRRDLSYNLLVPLRKHIQHFEDLKVQIEDRERLISELNVSRRVVKARSEDGTVDETSSEVRMVQTILNRETSHILEWLVVLRAYRGDITDSILQTIKFLEYEYFTGCAHSIHRVLPNSVEFRPLVEMTPELLNAQVQVSLARLKETLDPSQASSTSQSTLRAMEANIDNLDKEVNEPVDPIALALLHAQGFSDSVVRRGLTRFKNDMQKTLDWLIEGAVEEEIAPQTRVPTSTVFMSQLRNWEKSTKGLQLQPTVTDSASDSDLLIAEKRADSSQMRSLQDQGVKSIREVPVYTPPPLPERLDEIMSEGMKQIDIKMTGSEERHDSQQSLLSLGSITLNMCEELKNSLLDDDGNLSAFRSTPSSSESSAEEVVKDSSEPTVCA